MLGESSRLSLTTWGLSTKAAFGGVSKGGVGMPVFDVCHSGAGPSAFVAVQPGGSAGGVDAVEVLAERRRRVRAGGATRVQRLGPWRSSSWSADPPAATSVFPIAVPPTSVRASFRLGPLAQVLVTGS